MANLRLAVFFVLGMFFFLSITGLSAQDNTRLQKAFSLSYNYEAKADYNKAIEVLKKEYGNGEMYELNLRLGWLNYMAGFFTESLSFYQKAINLKPYAIEPRFGYINPASALGNWDQVVKQYNEIIKVDQQQTTANYRLGLIYYIRKDYSAALKCFEKVERLYPFDYDTVLMLGWTNLKFGKQQESKIFFNRAFLIRPDESKSPEKALNQIQTNTK